MRRILTNSHGFVKLHIAEFFASVSGLVDSVVALDDGSTDRTRELLEAEPLAKVLLTNPRRDGFRGWDDAENRNRLLAAASELGPRWILSLDADERIPPDDRQALAHFIRHEADPTCAYFCRVFALAPRAATYYGDSLWVGRLFGYQPGVERRLSPACAVGAALFIAGMGLAGFARF